MKSVLIRRKLLIKESPIQGYGVFADEIIQSEDIIEECNTLLTSHKYIEFINYFFKTEEVYGLALGSGSLYNHSDQPNATYWYDAEQDLVVFRAKRLIQKGEEILISYGNDWFSSRHMPIKKPSFWFKLRKGKPFLKILLRLGIILGVMLFIYLFLTAIQHK